jgi:hypothetical protein
MHEPSLPSPEVAVPRPQSFIEDAKEAQISLPQTLASWVFPKRNEDWAQGRLEAKKTITCDGRKPDFD